MLQATNLTKKYGNFTALDQQAQPLPGVNVTLARLPDTVSLLVVPPSKYDAAGNAGIINIITKKSKQQGYALDLTAGVGSGRYPQTTESVVGNVAAGKFNIFGNYSCYYKKGYFDRTSYRVIENAHETTVYDLFV